MSLRSLIASGTKVWLDSVHPDEVKKNRALGITGATKATHHYRRHPEVRRL